MTSRMRQFQRVQRLPRISAFMLLITASALVVSCGVDNTAPCKDYVKAYNEAYEDCDLPNRLEEEDACPQSINDGRDCVDYYQTLADTYVCDDGEVVHDQAPGCADNGS